MKLSPYALCIFLLGSVNIATAQCFIYRIADPSAQPASSQESLGYKSDLASIDSFEVIYCPLTQQLDFSVTYTANNSIPEGFWFVLSDGPNPKDGGGQYPIFYFDAAAGSGPANLSAYVYNGQNGATSHLEAGSFLGSSRSSPALSATASFLGSQASFAFSADVSGINSAIVGPDWEGTGFEQNLGIWYHTVTFDSPPTYNSDGSLSAFNLRAADFFDISNGNTIPEPSLALLGFFSSLLLLRRQR